jgi:signal transduction histidine kinase
MALGAAALAMTAVLVAPPLFTDHLAMTGETDPMVVAHAREAFLSALGIALLVGAGTGLLVAGVVSWWLAQRVAQPVERLAAAADTLTAGDLKEAVSTDSYVTEVRQLSEAFERMQTRLADSDQVRARLLADLAHEIRTPLSTLEAYIDGIEDGVVGADTQSWATMRAQVDRLRRLTTDLRDVTAADEHALAVHRQPLDVRDVVEAAVTAIGPRYQARDVALRATTLPDPAIVLGDRVRLDQVLTNLLDNALRHTGPGGIVDVTCAAAHGVVTVTITDTGVGLTPHDLTHVFDRFYRADPARDRHDGAGSGLGLTIARALVEAHGGTINAASPGPGRGTSFTVRLPADPQRPVTARSVGVAHSLVR